MNDLSLKYAEELSKLIQFNTISSTGPDDIERFNAFHKVLEEMFPILYKNSEVRDFHGSLLFKIKGENPELDPYMIMSHHDVVEALGDWKYPPFSGTIAEDCVWGRGAIDNKGMLWGMLRAVDDYLAEGKIPSSDLYIATTCNEENAGGGSVEIAFYLETLNLNFRLILDEGGMILHDIFDGLTGSFAMIGVTEKPMLNLKFTASGSGGHASVPPKHTPFARLAAFINEVENTELYDSVIPEPEIEMLKRMAPCMSGKLSEVCSNPEKNAPLVLSMLDEVAPSFTAMAKTTIAFTMAKGSNAPNVIPTDAYVIGNMRCCKHKSIEESIDIIRKIADKYDIKTEVIQNGTDKPVTDFKGSAFKTIEESVSKVFPACIPVPFFMNGGTDSRNYSKLSNNIICFTPIDVTPDQEKTEHGLNEFIKIESLSKIREFIYYILSSF